MASTELAELVAERAIRDTMYRYAWAIDHMNADEFLETFTEDGVFEIINAGLGSGSRRVEGRGALADYVKAHPKLDPQHALKHMNLNIRIKVSGSTARAESYFMSVSSSPEAGPFVQTFGVYEDSFVKCDDGVWRIKVRLFRSEAAIPEFRELPKHYEQFRSAGAPDTTQPT